MAATTKAVSANKVNKVVINIGSTKSIAEAKRKIQAVQARYNSTDQLLEQFAKTIEKSYMKPMLRKLRREEPDSRRYPDDYPIEFKSDAQRRKVMMILKGKPYQRTHGLQQGWYYKIKRDTKKISISIGNEKPYSRFVVGKFGLGSSSRQKRRYVEPMQKFHRKTGWTPAYYTVQKYLAKAKNAGTTLIQQWITEGRVS